MAVLLSTLTNGKEGIDYGRTERDYYEVLGVDKNTDDATIKKAYRVLAKNIIGYEPGDKSRKEI